MISGFIHNYPYLTGLFSFLVSLACMPIVIKIAKIKHFVVKPNKRTSHHGEIPNIGGLDIFISVMLTYMIFEFGELQEYQFLLIGLFIIFMIGFADDILDLSPISKLIGEMLAGISMICFSDIRLTNLHGFLGINEINIWVSYLLSFFVLVVIINALNLIDGIDGLASGLGIIYSLFFAIYFQLIDQPAWALLGYTLVGSLLVFFIYNVRNGKNKIFMGDSGSLLLGFFITAFVFHFCEINAYDLIDSPYRMTAAPAVMICVLSIPLFDTLRVALTRIKHHRSPFEPDKNHVHHLLLRIGLTHLQTTGILLLVSLCFIALAIVGRNWDIWVLVSVNFLLCCLLVFVLWRLVDKYGKQTDAQTPPADNSQQA